VVLTQVFDRVEFDHGTILAMVRKNRQTMPIVPKIDASSIRLRMTTPGTAA